MNTKTKEIKDIENQRFSGSAGNLRFQTDFHGFENIVFKQLEIFCIPKNHRGDF